MVNISASNFTIIGDKTSTSPITGTSLDTSELILYIIVATTNCVSCPFTVLLNISVIIAIKRRPTLQTNANFILACLAVTDALTGLVAQPFCAVYSILRALNVDNRTSFLGFRFAMSILVPSSLLHLVMVVFERLVAIKFPFRYPYVVKTRNIKFVVLFSWVYGIVYGMVLQLGDNTTTLHFLWLSHLPVLTFVFIFFSYVTLYFETRRHQRNIKTQQLPQGEVERFLKDNRALKTTVYVVGSISLCLVPVGIYSVFRGFGIHLVVETYREMIRTFLMLNSFLNPLIYCWRQRELRRYLLRCSFQGVNPFN
ncbi:trace amine-associated receptor 13c-like [Montipora capricornis]|uniref:trace amine-associated receptor 13c-like n=1 Tax=Montipora capricornis TaxID=246305 RepID=UPI0035F1ED58